MTASAASAASALEALSLHREAENRHDIEGIMATYAPAARVTINAEVFAGADAIRLFHERFGFGGRGAFALTVDDNKKHVAGDTVIVEQTVSGVHVGKWRGVEPTHKVFTVSACTIYSFDTEGKLISENVYFDASAIYRQLGIPLR